MVSPSVVPDRWWYLLQAREILRRRHKLPRFETNGRDHLTIDGQTGAGFESIAAAKRLR